MGKTSSVAPARSISSDAAARLGKALCTDFTERELEVLRELVSGAPNRVIAGHMNLSVDAVKYHLKNLLGKTGCKTRTELAVKACLIGILPPEEDASTQ